MVGLQTMVKAVFPIIHAAMQRLSIALKGGMRLPSWLHSMPCDTPSWSLFLLSLISMPAACAAWWDLK